MKKKLSVAVVSSSLLLNMLSSAAFAEPAGMYYAGKYYSADYIQTKMDAGDKTFASVVKKAQAAKSDAYVVLDDRNSYVTAKDYDFENGEATGDVSLLNESTPLKASYTNANSKESLKKVTPDSLKAAQISADGKTITFDLADSKYIKMSSTTSAYTLVDEKGAKGPVVSKVKADAKKKTLTLTLKTAVTAGTLYTVMYNKTDTGLDIKQPVKDTVAPVVTVIGLTNGAKVDSVTLNFTVTATDNVDTSVTPVVKLNGAAQTGDKGSYSVTLIEGENTITVDASDKAGNKAATQTFKVTYEKAVVDTEKPTIKVDGVTDGATVTSADLSFTVTVTDNLDTNIAPVVKLGDKEVSAVDGKYSVTLAEGANTITVTATDKAGNKAEATYKVTYEKAQVVTVTAITATNGTIDVTLSEVPKVAPVAADFKFTKAINGGAASDLAVTDFAWDATSKKASVKFATIEAGDIEQSVVVAVDYKGSAKSAEAFKVAAKAVKIESVSAINSTTLAVKGSGFTASLDASGFTVALKSNSATKLTVASVEFVDSSNIKLILSDATPALKSVVYTVTANQSSADVTGYTVAPMFTSEAIDSTHVKITFNTKVAKDGAEDVDSYLIKKISDSTWNSTTYNYKPVAASLDDSKKVVTLTLGNAMVPSQKGFVAVVSQADTTNKVQDLGGNLVLTGTEYIFDGVGTADSEKPVIRSASYTSSTKKLSITFSEVVSYTTVDTSKLSINGVTLTGSDIVSNSANSNVLDITLSEATNTKVLALTGDLTLTVQAGAFKDISGNEVANSTVLVSAVTPPQVTSVTYNEEKNQLTVKFSEVVDITTFDASKFKVFDGTARVTLSKTGANAASLLTTTNSDTLTIQVSNAESNGDGVDNDGAIEELTTSSLKLELDADAIKDLTASGNLAISGTSGVSVSYTADNSKPQLVSAEYDNYLDQLKLTFNEEVKTAHASIAGVQVVIKNAVPVGTTYTTIATMPDVDALNDTVEGQIPIAYSKTLTVRLTELGDGNAFRNAIEQAHDTDGIKMIVVPGAAGFADVKNNTNDAVQDVNGISINYKDIVTPTFTVSALNSTTVQVQFAEKVNAASATSVNSYQVVKNGSNESLAISKAVLQSDGRTVYLTTTPQTYFAVDGYRLTVSGVQDLAGNFVAVANQTLNFTGSSTSDSTAPTVSSVVATTVSGPSNDTLKVVFSETVRTAEASDISNYTVVSDNGTSSDTSDDITLSLSSSAVTAAMSTTTVANDTVTFTLANVNLTNGHKYKATVANVTDQAGNVVSTTGNSATSAAASGDSSTPIISTAIARANSGQDVVTVVFSEDIQTSEANQKSNYLLLSDSATTPTTSKTIDTVTFDASTKTATITLATGQDLTQGHNFIVKVKSIKDLAGNQVGTASNFSDAISKSGVVADTEPPTISSVTFNTAADRDNDYVTVVFSEDMNVADLADSAKFSLNINGSNVDLTKLDYNNNGTTGDGVGSVDSKTAKFILDTNDSSTLMYNLKPTDTVVVTASNLRDISGNTMASTTRNATYATSGNDTTAPTSASITVTDARNISLTMSEDIDSSTVSASDFKVTVAGTDYLVNAASVKGSIAADAEIIVLTVATPIPAGSSVTVAQATTGFSISDLAGNVATTMSPQTATAPATTAQVPNGATVKVGSNNTANYVSNASKSSVIFTVTAGSSWATTDKIYLTVSDGTHTATTSKAVGGTVSTKDMDAIDLSGFSNSATLTVTAYAEDASGFKTTSYSDTSTNKTDFTAPTSTITAATYTAGTDTLVLTGTNFDTAGAGDIKANLDWTKFVWDINADDATTANVTFAVSDITSATVTNPTTLTIVLAGAKGTALEGNAAYNTAGSSAADSIDISAGFIKDPAGNVATTDSVSNLVQTIN